MPFDHILRVLSGCEVYSLLLLTRRSSATTNQMQQIYLLNSVSLSSQGSLCTPYFAVWFNEPCSLAIWLIDDF